MKKTAARAKPKERALDGMTVLVTGGAGFIGSNFVRFLLATYPNIRVVNLDKLTYAGNLDNLADLACDIRHEFIHGDIRDRELVGPVLERVQGVFHFAAETHVDRSIVDAGEFILTDVFGTYVLLEALRRAPNVRFFIHVSTDEVYGSREKGFFKETDALSPSSPYAASKAGADRLAHAYRVTYGVPVMIVRPSNNYGPFQFPEKLVPLTILNLAERKPLPVYGRGANVRDWLYVEDHCEAIWRVVEKGRIGETYNVGGDNERRNIDVVKVICRVFAEETGAPLAELEELIQFVPDRPGHDLRYAIDGSKVRNECGWAPAETFETGLRKTVRWYLDNPAWVDGVRTGAYRDWLHKHYGSRREETR